MIARTHQAITLIGIMLLSLPAISADNMNLYGTLVEYQPCTINHGGEITVDFTDVLIEQVNGINYEKTLTLDFTCDTQEVPPLSLRHKGSATPFDTAAVRSNMVDFGIHAELETANGRVPFTIGKVFAITDRTQPSLQAKMMVTPVKKQGSTLNAGYFTATSTLQIEYQ